MEIVVEVGALKRALEVVKDSASKTRSYMSSLPVLQHAHIHAEGTTVRITTTDLGITTTYKLHGVDVVTEGVALFHCATLMAILKACDEPVVRLETGDAFNALTTADGFYSFTYANPTEFPEVPRFIGENAKALGSGNLTSKMLVRAVNHVLYATAHDEMREALNHVQLKTTGATLQLTGCDGNMMARSFTILTGEQPDAMQALVHPDDLKRILRVAKKHELTNIYVDVDSRVWFDFDSFRMIVRCSQSTYPDVDRVIPATFSTVVEFDRLEMIAVLTRIAAAIPHKETSVKLHITEDRVLVMTAYTREDAIGCVEVTESITVNTSGASLEWGARVAYLRNALLHMDAERVELHLNEKTTPGVLLPAGIPMAMTDQLVLMMPRLYREEPKDNSLSDGSKEPAVEDEDGETDEFAKNVQEDAPNESDNITSPDADNEPLEPNVPYEPDELDDPDYYDALDKAERAGEAPCA